MSLLIINKAGIYCEEGDFYIDPWLPVKRAIITHAHSDHARAGMDSYLCHPLTAPILRQRLGKDINIQTQNYSLRHQINGVQVSFHPAGHLPGSAQIRVAYKGEVWVVSGDYKLQVDPLSEAFEPVECDHFITESTFGIPVYRWPSPSQIFEEINSWWLENQSKGLVSVLGAYSLGKAQRVLAGIDKSIGPLYAHGAVQNVNEIFWEQGLQFAKTQLVEPNTSKSDLKGSLIIAPPGAIGSAWSRKLGPQSTGFCSGWMAIRGARRRRSADRGFILSDHADWPGLNEAVLSSKAEHVYVTHGYKDLYARWLREEHQLKATPVDTLFEGENMDAAEA